MKKHPMMKCGHAANGFINKTENPVCVICYGIHPGATVVNESTHDLTGRKARCTYYDSRPVGRKTECDTCRKGQPCYCEEPSSFDLAFFAVHPDKPYDEYYCGCRGWN